MATTIPAARRRATTYQDSTAIPTREYHNLAFAYFYFNRAIFNGELPEVLITLQRQAGSYGYFASRRFSARDGDKATDEIALNPATFAGRSDRDILSTLVHEMVHVWQYHFGSPTRNGYHNREWANKMEAIGLMPSNTGLPGGRRVGQRMTHFTIEGGAFEMHAEALLASDFKLTWQSLEPTKTSTTTRASKVKYTCPGCGFNVWGKPEAKPVCGACLSVTVPMEQLTELGVVMIER